MITTMHPRYANFTDFVNDACGEPTVKMESRTSRKNRDASYGDFFETDTFTEVVQVARNGWPKGYGEVKAIAADILTLVSDRVIRPTIAYDVTGPMFDMGAVMEGVPEAFLRWEEVEETQSGSNQVLRIGLNCCVSGGIAREVIIRKGAALVALCEALELAGRRTEIVLCHSVGGNAPAFSILATVKESWSPLQGDQVAFALAHPDVLRRLVFAIQENCPDPAAAGVGGGYGPIVEMPKEMHGCDIYIGTSRMSGAQWQSTDLAAAWVMEQLKAQGVITKEVGS